ncbi:type II toxin-antitoxin system Phd/YefM family antitoxin [Asaia sp. As-1742]|uniref:type II toxin-antitoxin system Phd/YefM family antitoxin n=1 Tax=Asaia sp. As-1742 TaxID=2608325 RepID=UPI00141FEC61|nr:type II toxin-antitoxin system Phd/YefM family antitoxin [Asaia sp. As-1742]NIE81437.1 type II toxin-antitoxin system Phd/YefM family antitoxin [Asaia sp. As-1742]
MQRFSSLDLQRNVARVQEAALRESVTVSYHGRDRLVIMPVDEFERLRRRDRVVVAIEDLPDEFADALSEPYANPAQAALDHLLDD